MKKSFNQTLSEIQNNMNYDIARKAEKKYAKLASIKRLKSNNMDIHGNLWEERIILEVGTIDLDSRRCECTNPINGMSFIIDIDKITFCDRDGNRIKHPQ